MKATILSKRVTRGEKLIKSLIKEAYAARVSLADSLQRISQKELERQLVHMAKREIIDQRFREAVTLAKRRYYALTNKMPEAVHIGYALLCDLMLILSSDYQMFETSVIETGESVPGQLFGLKVVQTIDKLNRAKQFDLVGKVNGEIITVPVVFLPAKTKKNFPSSLIGGGAAGAGIGKKGK